MFGRRKKDAERRTLPPQDAHPYASELPEDPAARERARLLECWRLSEQRVLRTWHVWQAAAAPDKPERYRDYLRALADEERAAAAMELAVF